ncbi:MAG TPA: MerR family transcriptional regulator [Acidimicrobiales bacterium]|jgi:AcrR family transcriptional regulator|nr:MerR family transcriptional regulator [Acidimicrobiales bacterium]
MSRDLPGSGGLTMSQLVEQTGVAAATIRYYLAAGLLPPPEKLATNRFLYDARHVELLKLIRLLRERRGLSLEAIGRLLPELVPDLLGRPSTGVFRREMWGQLLAATQAPGAGPATQARILEAGIAAFSRHGYADVSIDDVCRAAAVAKGSFYRHYASKEELFFAAARAAGSAAVAAFEAAACGGAGPAEATEALAEALAPQLSLWLDVASFATQRRPGHARVLRALVAEVTAAVARHLDGSSEARADAVVERAMALAVRRALDERAVVPALAGLKAEDAST